MSYKLIRNDGDGKFGVYLNVGLTVPFPEVDFREVSRMILENQWLLL